MAAMASADEQPLVKIGHRVGPYEVVEALGLRGLADRYLARTADGTERMLGVVPAQHPELVETLAEMGLQRVRHPNVLRVHEVLNLGKLPVLVTDVVRGPTLRTWLAEHPRMDADTALLLFRGLLEGAAAIHAAGLVHRDLRPETVLVTGGTTPVGHILDLGIATAVFNLVTGGRSVTTSGSFIGQPHYWAPERARKPQHADHRADLFSLGCILYELFAGVGPFAGLNLYDCYHATLEGSYRPLSELRPDAPMAIQSTVQRLLQARPGDRLQSVAEILERLDLLTLAGDAPAPTRAAGKPTSTAPHRTDPPPALDRTPLLAAAGVGAAVVGFGAWWWWVG